MTRQERVLSGLNKPAWIPPLLARVTLATAFVVSGIGKFKHLDKDADYFKSLNVPAPKVMVPFVASQEVTCGALLGLGLLTRAASVPLIPIMVVAIATARKNDVRSFSDLTGIFEFSYILLLSYLLTQGGGAVSLDALLARRSRIHDITRDTGVRDIENKIHRAG